jgi:hypothetical protein
MSKFTTRNKSLAAAAAVLAFVAVGGGVANAASTTKGTGSHGVTKSVKTITSSIGLMSVSDSTWSFDVVTGPVTGGPLTPGGLPESVAFTVSNDSTTLQLLTSVTVSVANPDGSAWTSVPGCSSLDYVVLPTITVGLIPVGGYILGSVTVTMNLLGTDQSGCNLATIPLHFATS